MNFPEEDFNEGRLYNKETIEIIVKIYRDIIIKYCDCLDNELLCYIFEKANYHVKNNEIKDGFHLIFPNLILDKKIRHLIVEDVIQHVNKLDTFSHLSNQNVIDKQIVSSNAWMLYGCSKPNCSPLSKQSILWKVAS